MFPSTLGAALFSLRGQNRQRTCDHAETSPVTLDEDQAAPPLRKYDAGGRCSDGGPNSRGVDVDSAHEDRFRRHLTVARLAASVEGLEARLDLQERQLQRVAGQVAKEPCGLSAGTQSDHGTATAEGQEMQQKANTSEEPLVGARKMGADVGVFHTASTSMGTRSIKTSSKKTGRNRRLHDLKINGTPKLDLHHGSENSCRGMSKWHRHNRYHRLK